MPFVVSKALLELVNACQNTLAIRMKDVDRNVFSTQIVHRIRLAFRTNVKTHVLEAADKMPNVMSSTTCHLVPVSQDTSEIHIGFVICRQNVRNLAF